MAKLLRLDDETFLPRFREMLRGGMTLGPLLDHALRDGHLWVWVPNALTSLNPDQLQQDIFFPNRFSIYEKLKAFLRQYLSNDEALVIADTSYTASDPKPSWFEKFVWFSCDSPDSPRGRETRRFCLVLTQSLLTEKSSYDHLMQAASQYPTTITLTSLPAGMRINSGEHFDLQSLKLRLIIERTTHVLLGVFDERSMMIWSHENLKISSQNSSQEEFLKV